MPVIDDNSSADLLTKRPGNRPRGLLLAVPLLRGAQFSPLARQFINFAIVGIPTTLVHYSVLIALVEIWHVSPVVATTAGFTTAAALSYWLNRRYTFDVLPQFGRGLALYYAIVSVGLILNVLIVASLTRSDFVYIFAQVIATCLVLIWNFLAARFIVFRE